MGNSMNAMTFDFIGFHCLEFGCGLAFVYIISFRDIEVAISIVKSARLYIKRNGF